MCFSLYAVYRRRYFKSVHVHARSIGINIIVKLPFAFETLVNKSRRQFAISILENFREDFLVSDKGSK